MYKFTKLTPPTPPSGSFQTETMSPRHGGESVAEVLRAHGVKYVFTLVGGHISPILVACEKLGIRIVDTRHEATAVFAADAVARLSGASSASLFFVSIFFCCCCCSIESSQLKLCSPDAGCMSLVTRACKDNSGGPVELCADDVTLCICFSTGQDLLAEMSCALLFSFACKVRTRHAQLCR